MVKPSGCAGISSEKWKTLKGWTRKRWGLNCPSSLGRKKDDPGVSGWQQGYQLLSAAAMAAELPGRFFHSGCQLAGAEMLCRRGFDSSAIAAMAPCLPQPAAAGTPWPHLRCPPAPAFAPGLPPSPLDPEPETFYRLNLKAPGDAKGRWDLSSVDRKVLHPSALSCIWVSLHPSRTFKKDLEPGSAGSQLLCSAPSRWWGAKPFEALLRQGRFLGSGKPCGRTAVESSPGGNDMTLNSCGVGEGKKSLVPPVSCNHALLDAVRPLLSTFAPSRDGPAAAPQPHKRWGGVRGE